MTPKAQKILLQSRSINSPPVSGMMKAEVVEDDCDGFLIGDFGTAVLFPVLTGVFVGVLPAILVGVDVGVLVGVFVGVVPGIFVGVLEGVLVGVSVGVLVGVLVGVSVGVLVGVFVAGTVVFVGVLVGVFVAGTDVFVGVLVGVLVGGTVVFVGVLVGVFVGGTGVFVGVLVGVFVGPAAETTKVFLPVAVWGWHPGPLPARTVKVVEPAGVAPVVEIVRVDVFPPGEFVTAEGLNTAEAPVGKIVVRLNGDVQEPAFPLKPTVIV